MTQGGRSLVAGPPALAGVLPPASPRGESITAKILAVDDDPRNLLAVEAMLQAPGVEIVRANSGEEALRHALKDDFAVILLDVQMPRIDGYEVANMIRARPRSARVPIIFLTAFNKDDRHVAQGYSVGAVDYVFKPIEPVILRSKVGVFVDLYRRTEEVRLGAEQERALLIENLRVRGEKLAAEQALRRREEHQSLVIGSLPMALYTASASGDHRRLNFTSESVERITGFSPERFSQKEGFWASRLNPDDAERVLAELARVEEAGLVALEYRWRCADDTERHFIDQVVMIRDEDGGPHELFGLWLDNTERKGLEQSLAHASKLEAIGRLTGGIAHDFNNMLSVVIGNLDLLQRAVGGNDLATRRARLALEGALRCAELTKRLLAFSRRQPLQAGVIDLQVLVPDMLELLQRTLGESIEVALHSAAGLWPVLVDGSQLENALVNLAVNARDAMPEGGALTITMENRELSDGASPGAEHVMIEVADTGTGMTQEVLERVFEPFFTTKEVGKGTGLGLSMIHGFVNQSGGHVEIESRPGQGTQVRLLLPRTREVVEAAPAALGAAPEGEGETILVVEDDPQVRAAAVSTLEAFGYRVLQAGDGRAAIDALDLDQAIRLVFSDVRMPGMTGVDLAEEVRRRRPDLNILLTSGHADAEPVAGEDGVRILAKPYRADDLARTIRALLEGSSGEGAEATPMKATG